ncbi:MAG: ATP-binding protein [bacterium]|nr:ATP-binding protein [bacterium]
MNDINVDLLQESPLEPKNTMIVEFSVKNFKSISEEQTLSFVATGRDREHPENLIELDVPGMSGVKLLKSAIIYGANASGKTNVLQALGFMIRTILVSFYRPGPGSQIPVTPFVLDEHSPNEPSRFELDFIAGGIRYKYGFILDKEKVHEEWLDHYPQGKPARVFKRESSITPDEKPPSNLKLKPAIFEKTRLNALYLSTAAQFREHESIYLWFQNFLSHMEPGWPVWATFKPSELTQEIKSQYELLIREADFGITGFQVRPVQREEGYDTWEWEVGREDAPERGPRDRKFFRIEFLHPKLGSEEGVFLSMDNESAGTQRFFTLIGPWLSSLSSGGLLFVDEIESSLHPILERSLIGMFHNPRANTKSAQLLMTTHDTTLLDLSLFRRDQIWFTEKNESGATELYSLSDYTPTPRKEEAIQKGYLAGRYGAIPILGASLSDNE